MGGLDERQWDQFFELMNSILNMPGDWYEKYLRVREEARLRGQEKSLEEFGGWPRLPEVTQHLVPRL
jgi:hypothetical protein